MTNPEQRDSGSTGGPASGDEVPPRPVDPHGMASVEWHALLSRFGHGSDSALAQLVGQEAPRILRRIAAALPGHLQPRVGASDILQQTLVDLMRVQDRFDNRGAAAFRKLMNTMAEARVAQAIRRERARKRDVLREVKPPSGFANAERTPQLDRFSGNEPPPSQVLRLRESGELLQAAIARLSVPDREVLQLIDYDEVGYPEAAQRLGLTLKAVQKRHSRALQRLRDQLGTDPS